MVGRESIVFSCGAAKVLFHGLDKNQTGRLLSDEMSVFADLIFLPDEEFDEEEEFEEEYEEICEDLLCDHGGAGILAVRELGAGYRQSGTGFMALE